MAELISHLGREYILDHLISTEKITEFVGTSQEKLGTFETCKFLFFFDKEAVSKGLAINEDASMLARKVLLGHVVLVGKRVALLMKLREGGV